MFHLVINIDTYGDDEENISKAISIGETSALEPRRQWSD